MSTFNLLTEIKNLGESLKCGVCKNILDDPLLIAKCGHTTCKHCFMEHLGYKCPICNIPINSKEALEDKQLKDLLVHLKTLEKILQEASSVTKTQLSEEITPANKQIKTAKVCVPSRSVSSNLLSSTPKLRRKKTLSKQSNEEHVIQESPEISTKRKSVSLGSKAITTPVSSAKKKPKESVTNSSAVQSPANLNKRNHKGETLLHRAVIKGDIAKVKSLIEDGAVLNTQDNNGWTPLHEACNHGYVEVTKLLLDHGALINVPSLKDNITPLHDAIINDQIQIAILLVSRGADLHVKTSLGNTALDLCKNDEDRSALIDACSPFINANISVPSTKVSKADLKKIVFLPTNLSEDEKDKLLVCAVMLKAEVVENFSPEVTHIVTSCDNMGNCVRTLKIFMGILTGKWIINFQWIEVCLEYKQKVDEEVFEVQGTKHQPNTQGPKHGRDNMEQKFPPLFDGFSFYLHGQFTKPAPERTDISNLVSLGGGKILSREPRPETIASDQHLIPYHASGTPLEDISHIILYQDKPPRDAYVCSGHICTIQIMWLIECISEFKLLGVQLNKSKYKDA